MPCPNFGVDRAQSPDGVAIRCMNWHTQVGPDAKVGDRKVAANAHIRWGIFDDQGAVVTLDQLTERMACVVIWPICRSGQSGF